MGAGIGTGKQAGDIEFCVQVPGHLAATVTELVSLLYLPHDFDITAINVIPTTAVTGIVTHTTHYNIMDDAAEKANIDFVSGVDLVAHTPKAITVTAWTLDAGDHLNLQIEKVGNGVLIPATTLQIQGQWA